MKTRKKEDMRAIERTTSGQYRCTLRRFGKRLSPDSFPTLGEAQKIRDAFEDEMRNDLRPGGITVRQWGVIWLRESQLQNPDYATIESKIRLHIDTAEFADTAVKAVTAKDVRDWAKTLETKQTQHRHGKRPLKPLSKSTRKNTITVLRAIFKYAVDDEMNRCQCVANPVLGVSIKTTKDDRVLKKVPEDVPLRPREMAHLVKCHQDNPERHMVEVAFGSGLRQGEFWNLELRDVHLHEPDPVDPSQELNFIYVRWGSKGRPPKNGHHRKVPLFGIALEGMERWLQALPGYAPINPDSLVFPTPQTVTKSGKVKRGGYRRGKGKVPRLWVALQKAEVLGPGRRFWWHALRHTCATALLCGWWGRRWELIEVSKMLGHSSVEVTTMYSHLLDSALNEIAALTHTAFAAKQGRASAPPAPVPPTPSPAATRAAAPTAYQPRGAAVRTGGRRAQVVRRARPEASPRASASDSEGPRGSSTRADVLGSELSFVRESGGRSKASASSSNGHGALQLVTRPTTPRRTMPAASSPSVLCPEIVQGGQKHREKPTKMSVYGTEGRTFESSRARESSQVLSPLSADEIGHGLDNEASETPDSAGFSIDEIVGSQRRQENGAIHEHAGKAQRFVHAVASGRQDAWRMAEDLAMALLMSKADKRHHEAARLVLKDQELRIPRALELAVKLMGPAPKAKAKPKKNAR